MSRPSLFGIVFFAFCATFCLFAFTSVCSGAEAPKIIVPVEHTTPEVEPTGRLLRIEAGSAGNTANTPPGTMAARIAAQDTIFEWFPSQAPGRITGGADFIDAALSPDESVLVIAERIGGNGPNSTRLVFFNLCNDKLVQSFELEKRKLADIAFSPEGDGMLWAVEEKQSELDAPPRLLGIDPADGRIAYESVPLEENPAGFAAGDGKLWITLPDEKSFLQFRTNSNSDAEPEKIRSAISGARLQLTPDAQTLLLFGAGRMERFRVATDAPEYLGHAALPGEGRPEVVVPLADDGSSLAIGSPGEAAYLVAGGAARKLADDCGETGCFRRQERELFLAVRLNEAIQLYSEFRTTPVRSVSPGDLRPFNKNTNWRLFALSGEKREILLIDHRGNINRLEIKTRRWSKTPIFTVPES